MSGLSAFPPVSELAVLSVQGTCQRVWQDACFFLVLNGKTSGNIGKPHHYSDRQRSHRGSPPSDRLQGRG